MNATVLGYCQGQGLELTRSRPYKKNDPAWVEQKNGARVAAAGGLWAAEAGFPPPAPWRSYRVSLI